MLDTIYFCVQSFRICIFTFLPDLSPFGNVSPLHSA